MNKYITNYMTKTCKKNKNKDTWIIKENTHEAIIPQEKYNKVQDIKKSKFSKKENEYHFLLKDLLYCGHCKHKLQYKIYKSKDKTTYLYNSSGFICSIVYKKPDKCKNKVFINGNFISFNNIFCLPTYIYLVIISFLILFYNSCFLFMRHLRPVPTVSNFFFLIVHMLHLYLNLALYVLLQQCHGHLSNL